MPLEKGKKSIIAVGNHQNEGVPDFYAVKRGGS